MGKRILLYFTALVLIHNASAQNVGIGTINPTGRLHIDLTTISNEDALIINDDTDPVVRFRRNGTDRSFFQLLNNDFKVATAANNDSGRLILRTNGTDRVYINPNGNVGIAASDPQSRLHIGSGSDVSLTGNGFLMLGNEGGQNVVFDNNEIQARNDSVASSLFLQGSGGATRFGRTNDSNIEIENSSIQAFFNGNTETLILQGNPGGKVRLGNGLDFATTKLHISTGGDAGLADNASGYLMIGSSSAENIVFDNNEILARNNGVAATLFLAREGSTVQLGNGTPATGSKLHISTGSDVGLTDALSGYLMIGAQAGTNIVVDNNEVQARNNGVAANLFLQANGGNVRIGEGDFLSSHKLGVAGDAVITGNLRIGTVVLPGGYRFGVDGKVICEELRVQLSGSWPDYVFTDEYKLMPLDQLQQYIHQNKKLPNIPAAAEIENSGLEVGDMQKRMMEKVEELTLYILELKKEIELLKRQSK